MAHEVEFDHRNSYIYALITGDNSAETVFAYMDEVTAKCEELDCFRVLIHECLDGPRLSPMEVFEIISEGAMKALGKFDAVAFVDEKMGDVSSFAENVAINRGMPIAMFPSVAAAEIWISQMDGDSDSQRIFRGDFLQGDPPTS
jgi:hypothetical protein